MNLKRKLKATSDIHLGRRRKGHTDMPSMLDTIPPFPRLSPSILEVVVKSGINKGLVVKPKVDPEAESETKDLSLDDLYKISIRELFAIYKQVRILGYRNGFISISLMGPGTRVIIRAKEPGDFSKWISVPTIFAVAKRRLEVDQYFFQQEDTNNV